MECSRPTQVVQLAYKAWRRHGPQDLTSWTGLAQAVLDGSYGQKWPDAVFQEPDSCAISVRCTDPKRRILVIYFTCITCYNT
ncbi:hypothetical protein TNCV_3260031 [Trichonephila clavipes]|nr:hypothetical protein TNCV_3260031 [Trichonephila clavipes]